MLISGAAILLLVVALSATASPLALPAGASLLPPLEPAAAILQGLGLSGLAALGRPRPVRPGACRSDLAAAPSPSQ